MICFQWKRDGGGEGGDKGGWEGKYGGESTYFWAPRAVRPKKAIRNFEGNLEQSTLVK